MFYKTLYLNAQYIMMKKAIFNLIQRFRNLIYHNYLLIYNNVSLLNFNIIIFLFIILYYFISDLFYNGFLGFLLSTIISFYVFYKYSYSQIFKTILKYCFIFIVSLFIISFLIAHFELMSDDGFNLGSNVSKMVEDNTRNHVDISNINVSPLEELLRYSFAINILIFVLLCSLTILLVNRYVLHGNLNYFISFLEKYLPNKYIPTLKGLMDKSMNYNNKFIKLMLTINGILFLILLFLNIFVTAELVVNIEAYVDVYNLIHSKKSIICIISMNRLIKSNSYVYPAFLNNKQHIRFNSNNIKDMNSFIPSDSTGNNDFIHTHISSLFDNVKQILIDFVRPEPVEGYLDDLLGQQLFIHFLLIIIVVSLIFLFSVFLFIQTLHHNKDYILKRFNNKFVLFYIKYQILLSKISLFILPVFIMFGLIELFIGLYFIITHPIPYDLLPVDLHFYFKK